MLKYNWFRIIVLFIIVINVNNTNAQSKSVLKDNNIKSITVYEEKFDKGKSKNEIIESVTSYDIKGNIIEEKEYNSEGNIKKHFQYKYDDLSRKIKEIEFDENGNVIETIEYKYQEDFKIARIKYDGKGNLVSKKRYEYSKFE